MNGDGRFDKEQKNVAKRSRSRKTKTRQREWNGRSWRGIRIH